MSTSRSIRWAQVEYQPNLQKPAKPVPLGIVTEVIDNDWRTLLFLGRQPIGNVPGLQLEEAWGPFGVVVSQWAENFARSIHEFIGEVKPTQYVLDELAQRWKWNLYLRQPTTSQSTMPLVVFATRRYRLYVGKPFGPERLARQPKKPWARLRNEVAIPA